MMATGTSDMTVTGVSPRHALSLPAPPRAPATPYPESIYLQYLPAVYRQDPFLRRLLLVFEAVLAPLEQVVGSLALYTEPELAPEEFLPWLAHWVAVSLDSRWRVEQQRALIAHAVKIYRWRGTRRGLKLHLQAYTGVEPLIQERREGFVLGGESRLGWTTQLVRTAPNPVLFVVTIPTPDPGALDPEVLRAIVEEDKPAYTAYRLHVVRSQGVAARRGPAWPDGRTAAFHAERKPGREVG
jgi:phage tail-like protein